MPSPDWFICQRCNNCCRWPGFVRVTDADIARLAAALHLDERAFIESYCELMPNRSGLTLKSRDNHECIFFDGTGCSVHAAKPLQCRNFPNGWNFPGWREMCRAVPVHG